MTVEGDVEGLDPSEWMVPPQCIPIHTNVTTYDWTALTQVGYAQLRIGR